MESVSSFFALRLSHPPLQQLTETSPAKNVVVFGESGVGKSSLINLIAGRSIAATSSGATGCTFRHERYELQVDDVLYAIWDTAGLGEGSYGTVPADTAEEHLTQLLRDLTRSNGVHLLVYCILGGRLRQTLVNNYNLFYSTICRKKVPIVVVVTGLEYYEGEMENWWTVNEMEFRMLKMHFDGHACVTTLNEDEVGPPHLKQRCHASREAVHYLITRACRRSRSEIKGDSWASAALADVRAMFNPARHDGAKLTPIIVLYDFPEHTLGPIVSVKDTLPFEGGQLMDVGGSPTLVYRIRDQHLRAGKRFKKQIVSCGADLLIFCASVHGDAGASRLRVATFHELYAGDMRPLLVVVKDAPSDESAREWWDALNANERHHCHMNDDSGKLQALVRALPPAESAEDRRTAVAELQRTIQIQTRTRSLRPVDVAPAGCCGWLTGGRRLAKLGTDTMVVQEDSLSSCDVWVPWRA